LIEVAPSGRRILIGLESAYLSRVFGPIALTVTRGDLEVAAPEDIQVTGELELDTLSPSTGEAGTAIELLGRGFDVGPGAGVRVRFLESALDPLPSPRTFNALDVVVESSTRITARVPDLPSDLLWKVYVEQGSITRRVISNTLEFYSSSWIRPPAGLIRLVDADLNARARFVLMPDGKLFNVTTFSGGVALGSQFGGFWIGTWSGGSGALRTSPCGTDTLPGWFEFEGTIDLSGTSFQVCCLDGSFSCEPRPCPNVRGTIRSFVRDFRTMQVTALPPVEVDNRYLPNGIIPPDGGRPSRDGFVPLSPAYDWTCPQTSVCTAPCSRTSGAVDCTCLF
jgi:hypothetical protein